MFFSDREKEIYVAPDGRKYDPLRVDRTLTVASGNQLDVWIGLRNAVLPGADGLRTGDVSAQGKATAAVEAARAEVMLADAARATFEFPQFDGTETGGPVDAVVLETLYHFLAWLEGKDSTVGTSHS